MHHKEVVLMTEELLLTIRVVHLTLILLGIEFANDLRLQARSPRRRD